MTNQQFNQPQPGDQWQGYQQPPGQFQQPYYPPSGGHRPPGRKRRGWRAIVLALSVGVLAVIAFAIAFTAGNTAKNSSSPLAPVSTPASASPAAAPQAPANTGPLGTTYKVSGTDQNGNSYTYEVTLLKIDPNAQGSDEFNTAPTGDHLVGAEFQIKGVSGAVSDAADNCAIAVGSDQQNYQPGLETIADGTDFGNGQFNVSAGQTSIGWVAFQVKNGVTVTAVQWTPDSGFGGTTGTWTIGA